MHFSENPGGLLCQVPAKDFAVNPFSFLSSQQLLSVCGPPTSSHCIPWELFEMQMPRAQPRHPESETQLVGRGVAHGDLYLTSPPGAADVCSGLKTTVPEKMGRETYMSA